MRMLPVLILVCGLAGWGSAQSVDDLYGVPASKSDSGAAPTASPATDTLPPKPAADSAKKASPDTLSKTQLQRPDSVSAVSAPPASGDSTQTQAPAQEAAQAASDSAKAGPAGADTAQAAPTPAKKPRERIVRETTVNTLDEIKGKYRSPKRALFMSLVVPGLGQAYVGHSPWNYARAVAYVAVDAALGVSWYHYSVVKHDRQVKRYRRYADEHWSQAAYEDQLQVPDPGQEDGASEFGDANPFRESYCWAVQDQRTTRGNNLFNACTEPYENASDYDDFKAVYDDAGLSADSIGSMRARFYSPFNFYELLGKHSEFITGWDDAANLAQGESGGWDGDSEHLDHYLDLRATANRYARMQAYFIGGIVLNHILSAVDAALTASAHNKALYQTEVRWYDRVRLDGGLALHGGMPAPTMNARISF